MVVEIKSTISERLKVGKKMIEAPVVGFVFV